MLKKLLGKKQEANNEKASDGYNIFSPGQQASPSPVPTFQITHADSPSPNGTEARPKKSVLGVPGQNGNEDDMTPAQRRAMIRRRYSVANLGMAGIAKLRMSKVTGQAPTEVNKPKKPQMSQLQYISKSTEDNYLVEIFQEDHSIRKNKYVQLV